jgi:hypothetical protein
MARLIPVSVFTYDSRGRTPSLYRADVIAEYASPPALLVELQVTTDPREMSAHLLVCADGTEEPLAYYQYGELIDTAGKVRTVEEWEKRGTIRHLK